MQIRNSLTLGLSLSLFVVVAVAEGQTAAPPAGAAAGLAERVAALKQSLAQSAKNIRTYEWIETTAVSLKGEVKSTKASQCYYGADGTLQKVPISASPPPEQKRGLRGAIIEKKKEEMEDTIKAAVALVKSYVPPEPPLIQRSKDAGKASMSVLESGKLVRLVFGDYRLPGDSLSIVVDAATTQLAGIDVATYLNDPSTPVTLNVRTGALVDGTTYPAQIQLALPSKEVAVSITNSGYKPLH